MKVHWQTSDYIYWLKVEDGGPMPAAEIERLGAGRQFSIPNSVFIGVGDMNAFMWTFIVGTRNEMYSVLTNKGYKVISKDFTRRPWHANEAYLGADQYGFVFFGHGRRNKSKFWG